MPNLILRGLLHPLIACACCVGLGGHAQTPPLSPEQAAAIKQADELIARLVADSQKHKVPRKEDPNDPLWRAEKFAADLAGDITEYSRWMVKIIIRYAQRGDWKDALYLADQLPGAGSSFAWSELARLSAQMGEKDQARHCLRKLNEYVAALTGQNAVEVNSIWAETLILLGDLAEAEKVIAKLSDVEHLELEGRLQSQAVGRLLDLPEALARLAQCESRGVDASRAKFLLSCAEHQFKKGDAKVAAKMLPDVGRIATNDGLPNAQRVLVDLARVAWAGGQEAEALKAMDLFFRVIDRFPDSAEWKPVYLTAAAEVLNHWGKREDAKKLIALAETTLKHIFIVDAPAATLAVAGAYEKLGDALKADALVFAAVKIGFAHPHPKVKATTAVQVALYYAEHGRPIPEDTMKTLNPPETGI